MDCQARESLTDLATITRGMFGGAEVRLSNIKHCRVPNVNDGGSFSGAVLLSVELVHFTKCKELGLPPHSSTSPQLKS